MIQKSSNNDVKIQIPKNNNELEILEEKSDVHILLIILVILSIPIVMGRIRNYSYPIFRSDRTENFIETSNDEGSTLLNEEKNNSSFTNDVIKIQSS